MREMIHQRDEERQISGRDALLVQRQDEIAACGGEQEIRVLHPFGDALACQYLAEIVQADEGAQLVIANFGVDSHPPVLPFPRRRDPACAGCAPRLDSPAASPAGAGH